MDDLLKTKPNVKQAVPFFGVESMETSLHFYMEQLGFEMKNKWIDEGKLRWCWLELGTAAIMLQEYRKDGHHTWKPDGKPGVGVSIYFICEDALVIYYQMIEKGVDPKEPFVGNNMWVTSVSDPDGYKLYFESPTDVAEETTLSQWKVTQ